MGHHRHGRHRDPLVGEHLLPAHEAQAATATGCLCQVGEGDIGVVEEHDAEAAHDNVEPLVEGCGLGVALDEVDVDPLFLGPTPGQRQHGRREVEAGHAPTGPYGSGRLQADGTVAAPDVQDPLARLEHGRRKELTTEGGEDRVEALGLCHPDIGGPPVPVLGHVGIRHGPFLALTVARSTRALRTRFTTGRVPSSPCRGAVASSDGGPRWSPPRRRAPPHCTPPARSRR